MRETIQPGLWSRYTKLPTPTPQFLKLRLRLLHKISIRINNGKPTRHFITTTWNHQATFLTYNLYFSVSLMIIVDIRALNLEYVVKILN
jgi:hypothetical protein